MVSLVWHFHRKRSRLIIEFTVTFHFAKVELAKAKDMFGVTACIRGKAPICLPLTGNPDDVRVYCKFLIDTCGKGGGYAMDTSALLDEANPENVEVMFEFPKENSVYG